MAGAGKKTFTAGEVLTASDVNTYLMEQSVMYFGGTAARSSAIPTPSTGMTTYIGVTGTATIPQIETYTGSAWQTPYGSTLVASASFSASTSVTINNCFTSAYKNYVAVFSLSVTSTVASIRWSPTATGTPHPTAGDYFNSGIEQSYSGPSTVTGFGNNGAAASFNFGRSDLTDVSTTTAFIYNPQAAERTSYRAFYADASATGTQGGYLNSANQFDGINITLSSGTGTLKIYGLRDS